MSDIRAYRFAGRLERVRRLGDRFDNGQHDLCSGAVGRCKHTVPSNGFGARAAVIKVALQCKSPRIRYSVHLYPLKHFAKRPR